MHVNEFIFGKIDGSRAAALLKRTPLQVFFLGIGSNVKLPLFICLKFRNNYFQGTPLSGCSRV